MIPEMKDLDTILEELEDDRLAYVEARSRCRKDSVAYTEAGISKQTFYRWPEEERTRLNKIAHELQRDVAKDAMRVYRKYARKAAEKTGKLIDSRNENVALAAAKEVSDRVHGKANQPVSGEVTGEVIIGIKPIDYATAIAEITAGSELDSEASGEGKGD